MMNVFELFPVFPSTCVRFALDFKSFMYFHRKVFKHEIRFLDRNVTYCRVRSTELL